MTYDKTLEEIWRVKREIGAEYPTLDDYFKGMLDYQSKSRAEGVTRVRCPPRRPLARRTPTVVEEWRFAGESVHHPPQTAPRGPVL